MSTAKLRIDLGRGQIEVEGSDDLVREVYVDFRDRLREGTTIAPEDDSVPAKKEVPAASEPGERVSSKRRQKRRSSGKSDSLTIVKDLDLSGKSNNVESLKEFYSSFTLKSSKQRNLVFIYYLEKKLELSPITPAHVFTCYRHVGAKIPTAFVQSLYDTARNGWIDTSNASDLKVTVLGINYVEQELPRAGNE